MKNFSFPALYLILSIWLKMVPWMLGVDSAPYNCLRGKQCPPCKTFNFLALSPQLWIWHLYRKICRHNTINFMVYLSDNKQKTKFSKQICKIQYIYLNDSCSKILWKRTVENVDYNGDNVTLLLYIIIIIAFQQEFQFNLQF